MPRRGGGGGARPAPRPAAAPPRPAQPQQSRPMSTATAQRPGQQAAPVQGQQGRQQGSGLFGQMASTAAGVAVGSSIGHALGGFFGGGSSAQEPLPESQQSQYGQATDAYAQPGQAMDSNLYGSGYTNASANRGEASGPCANDIKSFTGCMEQNRGDMNICGWYLEQLRACQQAAAGRY